MSDELQVPQYGEYFGPLFSSHLIGLAAFKTLKGWLPVYRKEIVRLYGIQLPAIRSWQLVDDLIELPELAPPTCTIINGGIARGSDPQEHSDGYRAGWGLGINITSVHPQALEAKNIVRLYAAAVRGVVAQHRGLGLEALGVRTRWVDEGYGSVPADKQRTRAQAENVFVVDVDQVVDWQLGPKGPPPDDPPVDYPEITDVVVDDVEVGQ